MGKNFDLDMIDEVPDALGTRNTVREQQASVPMKDLSEPKPAASTDDSHVGYGTINFSDFQKVDLRVGRITNVEDVPGAKKPLWKLTVDIGEVGTRTIVAGIRAFYDTDALVDSNIVVVVNLKPRNLAGILSEGMLLAAEDGSGNVSLIRPDKDTVPGCKIM